ncbi:MAG: M42 family peptidase [Haloferacaceae archaeon]
MDDERREFLEALLTTPSPSGFETRGQRVWLDYVESFADDVWTDAYGNAVAVHEGTGDGPAVAVTGHADEIGYIVRDVTEDGFLRISPIGGADRSVSKGQHVTIHADDGDVQGVIGQLAIHLRGEETEYDDLREQFVDVGVDTEAEAQDLVSVGDPVTATTTLQRLAGNRLAARGMDNRVGTWAAAEALRRAQARDVDATVYAVSTVQEEVGTVGAQMVGFDLEPDAVVAVDVTHATDIPDLDTKFEGPVELGGGPVVSRGSINHPVLVDLARETAAEEGIDVQLQAAGIRTYTDADSFAVARGGTPSLTVSVPNRYMHTPVEVVDTGDLDALADLLAATADRAAGVESFDVVL